VAHRRALDVCAQCGSAEQQAGGGLVAVGADVLEQLLISGTATRPHFRHADGSEYGHVERPHTIAAHTQVFSALRHLGFRERDIHAVLGELRKQNDLREAGAERLLREALQRLAPPRVNPIRSSPTSCEET
jgi:CBS-domain-containing membrane protein